ncbi:hypothetical protein B484DRAFT_419040, partial [Ochromonadaceae sp. CCMP2298]
ILPNRILPNRILPNRILPNRILPNRILQELLYRYSTEKINHGSSCAHLSLKVDLPRAVAALQAAGTAYAEDGGVVATYINPLLLYK